MFSNAIKIFTFNRFDIKVDPSWLIIAALITWTLSREFFPSVMPNASPLIYFIVAVIAMLGLFASLLLHELAHSIVARRLGVQIKSITLFLFGGVAELESDPPSARAEIQIAAAGPLMSLCLAAGFWVLEYLAAVLGLPIAFIEIASYLSTINLVLAIFNLLPAFPLDGGRILRAALWARSGNALSATRIATQAGTFLAYSLMGLGILVLWQGAIVAGLWQLIIGGFVLLAARASYSQELAKVAFGDQTVKALMTHDPVTASPEMTLSELADDIILEKRLTFVPVVEGDVLLGQVDLSILAGIERENWKSTRVDDVFVNLGSSSTIDESTLIKDLFETISKTGQRKFLVLSNHKLVGVVTFSDLIRHLAIHDQLQQPVYAPVKHVKT